MRRQQKRFAHKAKRSEQRRLYDADLERSGLCRGKQIYPSRNAARDAAILWSKLTGEPIEHYRHGSHWHIGHPKGWRANQGRQAAAHGDQS